MKKLIFLALGLFLVGGVVSAQNPHINKKDEADVIPVAECDMICFTGVVAGNGNSSSVDAFLRVEVVADTRCYNPAGGAKEEEGVPGQAGGIFEGPSQTFNARNGKAFIQNVCAPININPEGPNPQWCCEINGDLTILSVTLVINDTGFNDSQYFSRIFKKEFGLSPNDFRESGG